MNQRPWYDIALLIYIALAAGLEVIVIQKTSRTAWALACKALAIFGVFAYAYITVFYPALMTTAAGPVVRGFLAVAITWEIGELVMIGWTVLTSERFTVEERRHAARNMILGLCALVVVVFGLVLLAQSPHWLGER